MLLQRCMVLVQPMLGAHSVLAKVHGIAATHARCTCCPCKSAWHWCNPDVVHEVPLQRCMALVQPMLGAHSVLAEVHSVGASHAWCTWCPCKSAWCWCNPDVVHEVLLQRCMALVQPMLGAHGVLAEVHGVTATPMWCMRCSCKAAWHCCKPCLVHTVSLQRCMALVQAMLGAQGVLAEVHGVTATQMWCMRCPCKGV